MIITGYKLITPIATEAVTIDEVKKDLRLDLSDASEDDLIISYIATARQQAEDITGVATAPQTLELILKSFPFENEIDLGKWPVTSIISFKYFDSTKNEKTLIEDADFTTEIDADWETGKIVLLPNKYWPSIELWPADPIRIRFVAGITQNFPANLKKAIIAHACILYKFREELPESVQESINKNYKPFKVTPWF